MSLRESADALLRILKTVPEPQEVEFVRDKFHDYLELTFRLAEISSLVNLTWDPPAIKLPPELDLQQLASIALDQIGAIKAGLAEMGQHFGPDQVPGSTPGIVLRGYVNQAALNIELLKIIQRGNENIIIQNLTILQEGAHMSEYHINQTGNNLTAIVDSYKTTQLIGSGLANEVEGNLKSLLDGIVASPLPEQEKKDAVDATTTVAEEVKKVGHLAGPAKMIWSGLRERSNPFLPHLLPGMPYRSTGIERLLRNT